MDGSLACKRLQGRHIHPVSTHFAVTALPDWVYAMATYKTNTGAPQVTVDINSDATGNKIVFLSRSIGTGPLSQLWLLYPDFVICQQIVATIPIPLFPNESLASIMSRIKGALQQQFAGRGLFPKQR